MLFMKTHGRCFAWKSTHSEHRSVHVLSHIILDTLQPQKNVGAGDVYIARV